MVAPAGNVYYVDDNSTLGNQYTTAVGNDANSGKDPADPMASLGALTRAYVLAPGSIVYVDTGTYTLPTDLMLGSTDQGSEAPRRVTVPGADQWRPAVLNRNDNGSTANVIDESASLHDAGQPVDDRRLPRCEHRRRSRPGCRC